MKAITITNSKYQYLCSKSVKSFKRFNDIPLEIYFVGSEIENTLLGDFDCHYIDLHPGDIPNEFKWCKSILKEKLKIFLEQSDDFLFFENDVFFYKKLDFGIFKDGVSGVPEITDSRTKMSVLNGGFLFFKNIKLSYTVDDISSFMECSDYLPDEYFLSKFCSPINFLGYDVCYLNGTIPLVRDPVCVHCYGRYKPFVSSKLDFNKLKSFHARKLGRELG
jgi:hypothetical protein